MRNWKERWNPDAEFVFNKRLKLGLDAENPWVNPGDSVPKLELGISRLHRWWEAGMIRLDQERSEASKAQIVRLTSKCYEVRVPGKKIIRVNTKDEAVATLRLLTSSARSEDAPHLVRLNKKVWELHFKDGVEKIVGIKKAVERLHEVTGG